MQMSIEHELRIPNGSWLGMQPAVRLAQSVNRFAADIRICGNGRDADAKSPLGVLALGAVGGTILTVAACGADASQALATIEELLAAVGESA